MSVTSQDHEYSIHGPICPWCECEHDCGEYMDEDLCEMTCQECDQPFRVRVFIQTSWTTWKTGEEEP